MKTLKKWEFTSKTFGQSSYDWDAILDGEVHLMLKDEDYEAVTGNFASAIRETASKRRLSVLVDFVKIVDGKPALTSISEATGLVIQASPANEEQVAKWEARDEERKNRAATKKAAKKATAETEAAE